MDTQKTYKLYNSNGVVIKEFLTLQELEYNLVTITLENSSAKNTTDNKSLLEVVNFNDEKPISQPKFILRKKSQKETI